MEHIIYCDISGSDISGCMCEAPEVTYAEIEGKELTRTLS